MKKKTIRSVLNKKFNLFLESIEDKEVQQLVAENTIITGGCIVSMLLKEKVNDYDLYFRNRETALAVARYYVDKFKENPPPAFKYMDKNVDIGIDQKENGQIKINIKSAGIASEQGRADYQYFENTDGSLANDYVSQVMQDVSDGDEISDDTIEHDELPKYRPVFISANAITLSHGIQIIIRFFGDVDEIHENYDFVHCTSAWTSWDNELILRQEALECILAKELRYVGSKYPLCSIIRIRKFVHRGWTINAGQILKMCMNLNEMDLSDIDVLEDQLIGVDTAYFTEIINVLKKKQEDDLEKDPCHTTRIDGTYLITIIDRMF